MNLLSLYLKYHRMRTDAPIMYGFHLGIQLIGHSMGRESYCSIRPRAVRFNSNIALIGNSGVMKSTAQDDVMLNLIPIKNCGAKNYTPQGLMRHLEEQASLLIPMGEFSTYLRGINNGGYMSDFKEIVNDLFNCPHIYDKRLAGSNSYLVTDPYLSLNTTCTPEEFFGNIKSDMVNGGFLPRWLLIYATANRNMRGDLDPNIDKYETLLRLIIGKMYEHFKKHPVVLKLSKEADMELYKITSKLYKSEKHKNIKPFITRMENYIISYSCVLYMSDVIGNVYKLSKLNKLNKLNELNELINDIKKEPQRPLRPVINSLNLLIQPSDIKLAWSLLAPTLDYCTEVSDYVNIDLVLKRFLVNLNKYKPREKISWSVLMRETGLSGKVFRMAVDTFVGRDEIELKVEDVGEGKGKTKAQYIIRKEK